MSNTHETLTSLFTDIADAIRSKTGSEESIKADDFPSAIEGMEVGGGGADVSGVTAGTDDVVEGKIFVDSEGNEKTGTIPEKDADDISVSGATVNVPAGRYKEATSKAVSDGALSLPEISVNASGVITATSKVSTAGYLSTSSSKSNTKTLSTQSGTTITPGTSKKTAVFSGRYTTGTVYVAGDSNLVAENIKSGISIFGVNGSYAGSNGGGMGSIAYTFTTSNNKSFMIPGMDTTNLTGFILITMNIGVGLSNAIVGIIYNKNTVTKDGSDVGLPWVIGFNGECTEVAAYGECCSVSFGTNYINISIDSDDNLKFDTSAYYTCFPIYGE